MSKPVKQTIISRVRASNRGSLITMVRLFDIGVSAVEGLFLELLGMLSIYTFSVRVERVLGRADIRRRTPHLRLVSPSS